MKTIHSVTVQSHIDPELKKQAELLFANMGLSTAEAIRIFIQQTVNEGGLPFRLYTHTEKPKGDMTLLDEHKEADALAQSPTFHRLVKRSLNDVEVGKTLTFEELLNALPD